MLQKKLKIQKDFHSIQQKIEEQEEQKCYSDEREKKLSKKKQKFMVKEEENITKSLENQFKDQDHQSSQVSIMTLTDLKSGITSLYHNKNERQYANYVYIKPSPFINVQKTYKLFDDIFISEDQLLRSVTKDYDSNNIDLAPFNTFKYTTHSEINKKYNVLSLYFEDRQVTNNPPLDYIIERLRSFGNKDMHRLSSMIESYKHTHGPKAKVRQANKLRYQQYGCTEIEKYKIIQEIIAEYKDNLLQFAQVESDENGFIKMNSFHYGQLGVKILGYNLEEFQVLGLQQGFLQQITRMHSQLILDRQFGAIRMFQDIAEQKEQTQRIQLESQKGFFMEVDFTTKIVVRNHMIFFIGYMANPEKLLKNTYLI